MGSFGLILMLVVLGGMYFFMMRQQKKQQSDRQNMLNGLSIGDEIVTIGGLHGELSEINEAAKTITLDCEGVYLVFDRSAIRSINPKAASDPVTEVISETTEVETLDPEVKPENED